MSRATRKVPKRVHVEASNLTRVGSMGEESIETCHPTIFRLIELL